MPLTYSDDNANCPMKQNCSCCLPPSLQDWCCLFCCGSINAVIVSMLVVAMQKCGHWEPWTGSVMRLLSSPGYSSSRGSDCHYELRVPVISTTSNCKARKQDESTQRIIEKVGLATLFTNITAAIGSVFSIFTQSEIWKSLGWWQDLNIAGIFLISIILIVHL